MEYGVHHFREVHHVRTLCHPPQNARTLGAIAGRTFSPSVAAAQRRPEGACAPAMQGHTRPRHIAQAVVGGAGCHRDLGNRYAGQLRARPAAFEKKK